MEANRVSHVVTNIEVEMEWAKFFLFKKFEENCVCVIRKVLTKRNANLWCSFYHFQKKTEFLFLFHFWETFSTPITPQRTAVVRGVAQMLSDFSNHFCANMQCNSTANQ